MPQQGVTRDLKGQATALVVNTRDEVELRQIRTDRAVGDKWLVSDGLSAGDRVIVEGLQFVRPGAKVRVAQAGSGAGAPAAAASAPSATTAAKP
ncbi:Multidrug resistance protein MexA precursor [compost metagenome]